ncbi:MAG: hypothetical protein Q9162_007053 [Coniocarpon cinnabarinum]
MPPTQADEIIYLYFGHTRKYQAAIFKCHNSLAEVMQKKGWPDGFKTIEYVEADGTDRSMAQIRADDGSTLSHDEKVECKVKGEAMLVDERMFKWKRILQQNRIAHVLAPEKGELNDKKSLLEWLKRFPEYRS